MIDFIFLKDITELVRYLELSGLDILGVVTPFVYRDTFGNKYLLVWLVHCEAMVQGCCQQTVL